MKGNSELIGTWQNRQLRSRLSDSFAPFKCYPLPSVLLTKRPQEEDDCFELAAYRDALLQERAKAGAGLVPIQNGASRGQWPFKYVAKSIQLPSHFLDLLEATC